MHRPWRSSLDALYFPHLSLPASTWVNPALLFFDNLAVIAPEGGDQRLHDRRTQELFDLGMARPVHPYTGLSRDDDHAIIAYILGQASNMRPNGEFARVHAGKLAYSPIGQALLDARLLVATGDGWLEGHAWVVAHVMSYLAHQISAHSRRPLQLITNERAAAKFMVGTGLEGQLMSRRMRAVSRLLPVPPEVPPVEIDRFRRENSSALEQFQTYVTSLVTRAPMTEEGDASFEEALSLAERARDHLTTEMRAFNWREQGALFSISALQIGAAHVEGDQWSMGVGLLGLGISGILAASAARKRNDANNSRLVYATRAVRHWPPSAASALW